jgi:hypothetical protein
MTTEKTGNEGPVIVVGYDGSPTSRTAVDHAPRQAGPRGKVYLLHSATVPVVVMPHVADAK